MTRVFVIITVLVLGALACSITGVATQAPQETLTQPLVTNPAPQASSTPQPGAGQVTQAPGTTTESTQPPPAQVSTTEEPTKTPYPTSVLDAALSTEINLIQTQVVEERGLKATSEVPVVLLSTDQLRTNVVNDFLADYTDEKSSDDVLELSTVGLLEPNFDLKDLYTNLLSEQVAGYYDNETKEMFVVSNESFQGPERLTYSHEYTHVLQDQNYDIEHGLNYNDDACEKDSERCAGIQALLEGDATLSETIWEYYYATATDKSQIDAFYSNLKSPVYDSAPDFLKQDFVFPYNQGATFVQDIFTNGGWQSVDAVYKDPPVSTEQILHPTLYPSDQPIPVDLPVITSTLGTGWREATRNQMGEWYTYLIFAYAVDTKARLDDATAKAAAAGWGGDEYVLLHNDTSNQTVFVMKTTWDTANDATEFASAFNKYASARFGVTPTTQGNTSTWTYSGAVTSLFSSGVTTIWITAPDAATLQTVTSLVPQ